MYFLKFCKFVGDKKSWALEFLIHGYNKRISQGNAIALDNAYNRETSNIN